MKTFRLLAAAALLTGAAHAQVTGPTYTGYQRLPLLGNSDSIVSLPYARPDAAAGLVQSISGAQIVLQGSPVWAVDQFVKAGAQTDTFYALIESGAKEGSAFFITSNDATTLTLDLDGDTLTALAAGDRVSVIPCWTLATLFPGGAGVHASPTPGNRFTEILVPNLNATNINASAAALYYFYGGHWLKSGGGNASCDHDILLPDAFFTVRHNINTATELVCAGQVIPCKLRTPIGVNVAAKRDNFLGLQRATTFTLASSGLVASGAFAASPTPGSRTDELFVFDNTVAAKNKSAAAIYYYWNNAWRRVGAGAGSFDSQPVFAPGAGVVIRKALSATSPTWSNSPNY